LLAPTRRAPSSPATKSSVIAITVSTARTAMVQPEISSKSPTQAASSMPAKTIGSPGSAGRTMPARPTRISSADSA
jgi:hypothetical protein